RPGTPVAASTPRTIARANTRDAAAHRRSSAVAASASPTGPCPFGNSFRPVARANTVSPSNIVCEGRTAHARPSCAATANRRHCAFDNAASTATTPIVVFNRLSAVPVPAEGNSPGRRGQRVTPNSPPCSYSAAYGSPVSGRPTPPAASTTAGPPTTNPPTSSLAEPTPPSGEPACAPAPAPAVPWATEPSVAASHAAYPNAASGRRPHSPRGRSKMTAA